jgi:hypothetical protein
MAIDITFSVDGFTSNRQSEVVIETREWAQVHYHVSTLNSS